MRSLQLLRYTGWVQNTFLVLAVSVAAIVRRRADTQLR